MTQLFSFPSDQYYDDTYPSVKEQKAFEKNIFNKTHRTDSRSFSFHSSLCWGNHSRKRVAAGLRRKDKMTLPPFSLFFLLPSYNKLFRNVMGR